MQPENVFYYYDLPGGYFYVDASRADNMLDKCFPCHYRKKKKFSKYLEEHPHIYLRGTIVELGMDFNRLVKWDWIDKLKKEKGKDKCLNDERNEQSDKNRQKCETAAKSKHIKEYQRQYHNDVYWFFKERYGMDKMEAYTKGLRITMLKGEFEAWKENRNNNDKDIE